MTDQEGAAMTPDIVTEARRLLDAARGDSEETSLNAEIARDPRPATCPTCGSDNPLIAGGRRTEPCPDPWHGGAE